MKWQALLPYFAISILSLFLSYLLSRAYPYGVVHPDTTSYLDLGRALSFFHANAEDWLRTPPLALLLRFSLLTNEPTVTVMWFYLLLFTGNIVLTLWFALGIFSSRTLAFVFTSTTLFLEVSLMRTFYYNTQILADPLLAHLILLGSLLGLGGWIYRSPWVMCAGAGTLGLAALTKPVGLALLPIWTPFFVWAMRTTAEHNKNLPMMQTSTILCIVLFLGPTLLWSGRNALLYDHFQPTAFGGRNILPRTLPLLDDTDTVLDDPQKNRAFIREVRTLEREVGTGYNHYAWGAVPNHIGYWGILDTLTKEYQETGESLSTLGMQWDATGLNRRFFAIDPLAIRTALRLIWLHPTEYLTRVSQGYFALFDATHRDFGVAHQLGAPPHETYQGIPILHDDTRRALYPPSGLPDPSRISPHARALLLRFALLPSFFRLRFFPSFALLSHGVFLLSIALLWWRRRETSPAALYAPMSILLLFLTAASHYLLASATEDPLDRYALPGEMGLNIAVLLAFSLVLRRLFLCVKGVYLCWRHHSSSHKSAHT